MKLAAIQTWFQIGMAVFGSLVLVCGFGYYHFKQKADNLNNQAIMNEFDSLKTAIYDKNNNKVSDFTGIEVLNYKILSYDKGYMKIRVSKNYLNTFFNEKITLKYEGGKYLPVTLTFENDNQWGAGIIFVSPEHKNTAEVYFNKCFRFSGGGRMTYIEDLIFELFFNDYCMYFATISGMVKFEINIPPIRFGENTCIGYFDSNNNIKNKNASKDFSSLKEYFHEVFQKK